MLRFAAPLVLLSTSVLAQPCTPHFAPGYDYGTVLALANSTEPEIACSAVFDSGSGLVPYIGGGGVFVAEHGRTPLARFVDGQWRAVPGMLAGKVTAMAVSGAGPGAVLYVAGNVILQDQPAAARVVAWDGATWSVIVPWNDQHVPYVTSLLHVPSAGGPVLYVGGDDSSRPRLRRLEVESGVWSTVEFWPGLPGKIAALAWFDEGTGPTLLAGIAESQFMCSVRRLDGAEWSVMPGLASSRSISAFSTAIDAGQLRLCVTGDLGPPDNRAPLARLTNGAWQTFQTTPASAGSAAIQVSFPSGPALMVGMHDQVAAENAVRVRLFSNGAWTDTPGSFNAQFNQLQVRVRTFVVDPTTGDPIALGAFTSVQGVPASAAARWDGGAWRSFEAIGLGGLDVGPVVYDPHAPSGPIYSGSRRFTPGAAAPSGLPTTPRRMLRVNGSLFLYGGTTQTSLFELVNSSWVPRPLIHAATGVWVGTDTGVESLLTTANGQLYRLINSTWTPVGSGMTAISDVETYDDGTGPRLFVCGIPKDGGSKLRVLAGSAWQPVHDDVGNCTALAVADVGDGPELIIGRSRTQFDAGGVRAWNGASLRSLESGLPVSASIFSLRTMQAGTAAGLWCAADSSLFYWEGGGWTTRPDWVFSSGRSNPPRATSMAPYRRNDGGWSMFVAGEFMMAGDEVSVSIAELRLCSPNCTADFDADGDSGTDADIEAFFACLAGDCCPTCGTADFNSDGDTGTDADIESFFRVLAGGPC
jgi:hypothetical protein